MALKDRFFKVTELNRAFCRWDFWLLCTNLSWVGNNISSCHLPPRARQRPFHGFAFLGYCKIQLASEHVKQGFEQSWVLQLARLRPLCRRVELLTSEAAFD